MARYYNLIIFQPKNSGKLELGPKVGHRMELGAKFRPNLVILFGLDLKNAQI